MSIIILIAFLVSIKLWDIIRAILSPFKPPLFLPLLSIKKPENLNIWASMGQIKTAQKRLFIGFLNICLFYQYYLINLIIYYN
tara:strand:+ start:87 stop:335 length:249 start_codon:yes stop_codon:yes gene_type:complete